MNQIKAEAYERQLEEMNLLATLSFQYRAKLLFERHCAEIEDRLFGAEALEENPEKPSEQIILLDFYALNGVTHVPGSNCNLCARFGPAPMRNAAAIRCSVLQNATALIFLCNYLSLKIKRLRCLACWHGSCYSQAA
ncbi:MAG: hypothetical protein V2A66_06460 [Pseudomonadota bacterium]